MCPDAPLRLTFTEPAALGSAGAIQITDTTTGVVVDTIDVAAGPALQAIGGIDDFRYLPITVSGNEAVIHVRHGALQRGHTYAVTIAPGALHAGDEPFPGMGSDAPWRFTTRAHGPADAARIVVAADGTGDFCTVQGAFDSIPEGNRQPVTVFVRRGVYTEILCLFNKHAVALVGEDRRGTLVQYANNANFNGSGGNPYAGATPDPSRANPRKGGSVYRRGAVLVHQCDDFSVTTMTLRNTTPQGGSQAEALIVNSSVNGRTVIRDVEFFSYQDTIQINGQAYISGCHVEGDVDFLWGKGPSYFEECTFRSLRSGAYYTQVRNPASNHGFVFVRCLFEGAPGVTGNFLTRIEPNRFPDSEVVLLDCILTEAVAPAGWQLQRARGSTEEPDPARVRFFEHNSRTPSGDPVDTSQRLAASRQLRLPDNADQIDYYRDPRRVLGGTWTPPSAAKAAPAP